MKAAVVAAVDDDLALISDFLEQLKVRRNEGQRLFLRLKILVHRGVLLNLILSIGEQECNVDLRCIVRNAIERLGETFGCLGDASCGNKR